MFMEPGSFEILGTQQGAKQSKPLPAYILVEQGKGYIAKQALRDKVSYLVHDLV
jgi:hypothetical protein